MIFSIKVSAYKLLNKLVINQLCEMGALRNLFTGCNCTLTTTAPCLQLQDA